MDDKFGTSDKQFNEAINYCISEILRRENDGKIIIPELDPSYLEIEAHFLPIMQTVGVNQKSKAIGYEVTLSYPELVKLWEQSAHAAKFIQDKLCAMLVLNQPLSKELGFLAGLIISNTLVIKNEKITMKDRDTLLMCLTKRVSDFMSIPSAAHNDNFDGKNIPPKCAISIVCATMNAAGIKVKPQTAAKIYYNKTSNLTHIDQVTPGTIPRVSLAQLGSHFYPTERSEHIEKVKDVIKKLAIILLDTPEKDW